VLTAHEYDHGGELVAVTVAGETVESTRRHPYWVVEGRHLDRRPRPEHLGDDHTVASIPGAWVEAGDLQVGDVLLLKSGQQVPITRIVVRPPQEKVYNITVGELHCYAVGLNAVLVHNTVKTAAGKLPLKGRAALVEGKAPNNAPRPQPMVGRRGKPGIGENGPVPNGREAEWANSPLQPVRNPPATINGRQFSGHAVDQMQNRGIPPSAVENAIQNGTTSAGNRAGTLSHSDPVNGITVITNAENGTVITVIPGAR
jgi:filamentous hemagglutinin